MENNTMTERQPTPGVHENFAAITDESGQGSGLWCEPARDGRDQARDYSGTSHQAASAGHARGWRQALDAAVYATTSALSEMIVAGSSDLQEAHGKAVDAITSLYAATPAPATHVDVEGEIARVVQSVNEWDDRTSPEDYPDHLLITSEELADILRSFAATLEGRDNG
jgi:hypothetical protein